MNTKWKLLICLIFATTLCGCAKYPSTTVSSGKQVVITLRVAGRISPTDPEDPSIKRYYFIAIDNDNDQNTGPWAVVAPPYGGTGWVTSADAAHSIGLTSYFVLDPDDPSGSVYGVLPGSYFLNTTAPRPPIRYELIDSGATMRITIDLSQLATSAIPVANINQLNINLITTNQLAVNPSYTYPGREWDSLGAGGQEYINVDTTQTRIWSADDDQGEVNDPDLDITHWTIEVQDTSSR
jgi:hypothetical protein